MRNLTTGKVYVGSAIDIRRRLQGHIRDLKNNKHHSIHLQRAWNQTGMQYFAFEVVEKVEVHQLISKEQFFLDKMWGADKRYGYNISPTAGSALGVRHRAEVREAMSKRRKGNRHTETTKQIMSEAQLERFSGKGHSESTKKKIAAKAKGRTISKQTRKKISKSSLGRTHTAESKRKMSDALRGRVITEGHRIGMIETQSKLTQKQHHEICDLWSAGISLKLISARYTLAPSTVSRYVNGSTQKHWYKEWKLSRGINQVAKRYARLNQSNIFTIFELRRTGITQNAIAKRISEATGHKIGNTTVDNVLNGRSYVDYAQLWLETRRDS